MKISIPDFMAAPAPRLWSLVSLHSWALLFRLELIIYAHTARNFFAAMLIHSCIQVMRNGRRVEATAGQPAAAAFSRAKRTTQKL